MRSRSIAVVLIPVLALIGCGGGSATAVRTQAKPAATSSAATRLGTDDIEREPAASVLAHTTFVVTPSENTCIARQADPQAAIGCMGKQTILVNTRRYLEAETKATPDQVDCVVEALDAKPIETVRTLTWSGIGEAVYVPCGLPS